MATRPRCAQCGTELSSEAPAGLCPNCLRQATPSNIPRAAAEPLETTVLETAPRKPGAFSPPREGQPFGDYRLVRLLGRGGMGEVFEAEHLPSERRVALKILSRSLESPEARKRFLREGTLAASVNHPNSVYVFGTEEIEGTPVICMELVAGGTLKERVQKQGPLPVAQAVDGILQVISGLEAAQTKGVLHRDVKPSNCFVDADGTVKIGDYGLSLSLVARGETQLTVTGAFLGTPAYSSPEQLRGQEVDLRSDIYSVGVTLYYLLTGRAPFEGDNVVNLLATVLERPPASPASVRREVPRELAKVVLRCLEKGRERRFGNYDELRTTLLPFSSEAPTPAPLVLRAWASIIDVIVLSLLVMSVSALLAPGSFFRALQEQLAANQSGHARLVFGLYSSIAYLVYFGILEGVWGASLGKMQFRLRVVGKNRNAPGVFKAALRALLFHDLPGLPVLIALLLDPGSTAAGELSGWIRLASLASLALNALFFSTVRRANGLAAVHDLLTNTRVIRKPAYQARSVSRVAEEPRPSAEGSRRLGPFIVLATLSKNVGQASSLPVHGASSPRVSGGRMPPEPADKMSAPHFQPDAEEMLLSWDPLLNRRVWIRVLPPGTPTLLPKLRMLGRAGRLRLLNGKRTPDECWDAYEAVSGAPFLRLARERQSWKVVRSWLLDLAEELQAAFKDQTLPEVLALDRVWITADGHAKLLDFPSPGLDANEMAETHSGGVEIPAVLPNAAPLAKFLMQVAAAALQVLPLGPERGRGEQDSRPLPVHARAFLAKLAEAASLEGPIAELRSILDREAEVSRSRRFRLFFVCGLPQVAFAVGLVVAALLPGSFQAARPGSIEDLVLAATVMSTAFWVFFVILPSLVCALLFRGGYLIHRQGIAIVTADGAPASRLRIFGRSVVTWLPVLLAFLGASQTKSAAGFIMVVMYVFYLGVGIWTVLTPARSLQDRIAGTWLVPK